VKIRAGRGDASSCPRKGLGKNPRQRLPTTLPGKERASFVTL